MENDNLEESSPSEISTPIDDPRFAASVFSRYAKKRKTSFSKCADTIKRVCAEEYDEISRRVDRSRIQDSSAVRNVLRTRRLAHLLINDKGDLNLDILPTLLECLKERQYSLGPDRQNDAEREAHIIEVVQALKQDVQLQRMLKSIGKPYQHRIADQIIRDTLQLPRKAVVTDADARRAVLSAWMCYLRQNVGSCFATAPAIVVHNEQPDVLLSDLNEILNTGRLKRTFGGVEYAVPLSMSWGAGDLKRPLLLLQGTKKEAAHMALSAGMLAAFQAIHMIDPKEVLAQKVSRLEKILEEALRPMEASAKVEWTTAEEIIRAVLMGELQITSKDLEEYALRPRVMIQESLLMNVPKAAKKTGGKGEACGTFHVLIEIAKNAFKAVADNALLKSWEFTIASFAETKAEFTRWNLYSSLGLSSDQKGGIGAALYDQIKAKLDNSNRVVMDHQVEYEQVYAQLKFLEGRLKMASTEKELNWLRVEYESRAHEFYMLEEMRDKANARAHKYANLLNDIVKKFDLLFPKYFQEVYDADMRDVISGPYDDSPAGFRLLYKHGRSNTAQWSLIKTPQEYVEALSSFFIAVEPELRSMEGYEFIASDISDIVTSLVNHVRTNEFIETSFYRMAAAHNAPIIKDPLNHLDRIEKKPWAYTSGGGMDSLVSCYFCLSQKPTQVSRWVENEVELLVFFVDTLKQMPYKLLEEYVQHPEKSMLMYSPTHAFLLKPGISPLKESWQSERYTYTWIRDEYIKPAEIFWETMLIEEDALQYLVQKLVEKVPINFQPRFKSVFAHPHSGKMTPAEFRFYLIDTMEHDRGLRYGRQIVLPSDEIDSFLYQSLPLVPRQELYNKIFQIFDLMSDLNPTLRSKIQSELGELTGTMPTTNWIPSKAVLDIAKALMIIATDSTSTAVNYPSQILQAARTLKLAAPTPVLFADTNWAREMFAFLVNPGTSRLELWRVDALGATGHPMSVWKEWLNGSRRDIPWGIYTRPFETRLAP